MDVLDFNALFHWRALERILALIIAMASIYLGYRLFWSLREVRGDGEGKLELPGGISIFISRVGPGVFFALFGTAIVGFSITQPLSVDRASSPPEAPNGAAEPATEIRYAIDRRDTERFDQQRQQGLARIDTLNRLQPLLMQATRGEPTAVDEALATDLLIALPGIRRSLLLQHWQPQWGEPARFIQWVDSGDPDQPPPELEQPARLYLGRPAPQGGKP